MLFLSLLLSLQQEGGTQAGYDATVCQTLQTYEARQRATMPRMVDDVTRMDRIEIDCPGRAMTMHKTLTGDPANLVDDWRNLRQARWNELTCGLESLRGMIANGWRIVERTSFSDGRVIVYEARCS